MVTDRRSVAWSVVAAMAVALMMAAVFVGRAPIAHWVADPDRARLEAIPGGERAFADAPRAPASIAEAAEERQVGKPNPVAIKAPLKPILAGSVRSTAKAELEQCTLMAERIDTADGTKERRETHVLRGMFVLPAMTPGKWRLRVHAPDHSDAEATIDILQNPQIQRCDLLIRAGQKILIRFRTPEGESLFDTLDSRGLKMRWFSPISAVATREHPGAQLPPTESRSITRTAVGHYKSFGVRLPEEPAPPVGFDGILTIHGDLPIFVSAALRSQVLTTAEVSEQTGSLDMLVDPDALEAKLGQVTVTFLDSRSRKPASDVSAKISTRSGGGQAGIRQTDGSLRFTQLEPGWLVIEATSKRHAPARWNFLLRPGEIQDFGDIALEEPAEISGEVIFANGMPAAGAVRCESPSPLDGFRPYSFNHSLLTSADGWFRHSRAARGRHILKFESKGYASDAVLVDTSEGDVAGLRLVAYPAVKLHIRARSKSGELLIVRNSRGVVAWAGLLHEDFDPEPIELPAGSYTVSVTLDSRLLKTTDVRLDGAPFTLQMWP
ncbi:MAG: hypothetical protein JNJ88_04885 [Planctomycetes bacterium]|nr:hypothetical protein [Planctomycetota bacterium]